MARNRQYGYFTRPKTFRNSRLHCPKSEERGILLSFLFANAFFAQPHYREIEILRLIQKGLLSKEIADKLCISIHTVNIHRQNLLRKLGVQNSIEAIRLGQETGLLS